MNERSIEQYFIDVERVHNLDRFDKNFVEKTPYQHKGKRKQGVKYTEKRLAREMLEKRVADLIISIGYECWVTYSEVFEQYGSISRSYQYNVVLFQDSIKWLESKGFKIYRKRIGRTLRWKVTDKE